MNNIQLALTLIDYLIDKYAGSIIPASLPISEASSENNPWELLDLDAGQFGQESFQVSTTIPASTQPSFIPPKESPPTPKYFNKEDDFVSTAKETLPMKPSVEPDRSPPTQSPDKIDNQPGQFNDFDFDF